MRDDQLETAFGVTVVTAGIGVVTLALFPFALPILALLGVLAVPMLPLALVAVLAIPLFLVGRRAARTLGGRGRVRRDAAKIGVPAQAPRPDRGSSLLGVTSRASRKAP